MKKMLFTLLITTFAVTCNLYAQESTAVISFSNETHDFGVIEETNGKVTNRFEFTNTGGDPLVISKVKASCGCTTPDWSKEPIPPGGKGFVAATYNPQNRPGKFNKSITVTSNASTPTKILRISGEVKGSDFRKTFGDLGLKTDHVGLAKVINTETKVEKVEIINNSKEESLNLKFKNVPAHITVKANPPSLRPQQEGFIEITYDAKKKNDWGFLIDRVSLVINDDDEKKHQIRVSATIEEDFSKLTPKQLEDAPVAVFESTVFNFGTIDEGDTKSYEFKLKNTGKSDLLIRKTKASCGCTAIAPTENVIAAGSETSIKVTFNSRGKKGKQNKTVTVITNDPHNAGKNATVTLKVTGTVNAPAEGNK